MWTNLKDKSVYIKRAEADSERYEREMAVWEKKYPEFARKSKIEKKDSKTNGFRMFCKERRLQDPKLKQKEIAVEWKAMSEDEQKTYKEQADSYNADLPKGDDDEEEKKPVKRTAKKAAPKAKEEETTEAVEAPKAKSRGKKAEAAAEPVAEAPKAKSRGKKAAAEVKEEAPVEAPKAKSRGKKAEAAEVVEAPKGKKAVKKPVETKSKVAQSDEELGDNDDELLEE